MAQMIQRLEKLNLDTITAAQPRQMGKAKLVFLQPLFKVSTPKLSQAWPIKPADEKLEKFTLEVRLDGNSSDAESFKTALTAFDMKVRRLALENKKLWFGKAADDITSEGDLRQMHSLSVHKGSERQDGTRYDDTVRFKITGWDQYVEEVIYKGEGDKRYPVDVKWKSRLVDPQGHGGPDDNQTKFYICENRDMTTGKEQMAPWTPCQDPAGNQVKDASGNTMWEFVGPKHCQPGCKLTIVFQPTMVWLAAKFGITLSAKQVFITPAPPKPKNVVEGIEIKDYVDPILASRAAKQAMSSSQDLDEVPPEQEDDLYVAPMDSVAHDTVPLAAEAEPIKPGKRQAEASPATKGRNASKKSKTVTVDEDF